MDLERKLELVRRPPTVELVTEAELKELLATNSNPSHYIGLEISGPLHLGSLFVTGFKIRDLQEAGFRCTVFLADWHSYINYKLGGDWERIRKAASYYAEAFRFFCPGVEIVLGSELYKGNDEYWRNLVRFCKQITLARNARCLTIMGRSAKDILDFAQYLYPPMQALDIWALQLDLVHAGLDQRKVHMLVREVFPRLGWKVPVALHHKILPGLGEPQALGIGEEGEEDRLLSSKMSKSKPSSCIFIHDSAEEIRRKVRKAWCPERRVEGNPILALAELVMRDGRGLLILRPQKYGGEVFFQDYKELERAYLDGKLHPADLKEAVAEELVKLVHPVREHFSHRKSLLEEAFQGVE